MEKTPNYKLMYETACDTIRDRNYEIYRLGRKIAILEERLKEAKQ